MPAVATVAEASRPRAAVRGLPRARPRAEIDPRLPRRARSRSGRRPSTGARSSSPPSIARSTAVDDRRVDVARSGRRRLAAAVGAGLEERRSARRRAGRRSAARRAARGRRGRRAGSGARGWRRRASPGPGSSAPTASRVRGPSDATSSRIASGEKYMTAEGLPSSRPLSAWMRSIAVGVERVAGEPVEAVGREERDAAAGDAALERTRAASAPSRSIETISSRALHPHRRATTDRGRSRRGRGASRPAEAGAAHQLRDRRCLALADLERDRVGRRRRRRQLAASSASIASRPVGPGDQRLARLVPR